MARKYLPTPTPPTFGARKLMGRLIAGRRTAWLLGILGVFALVLAAALLGLLPADPALAQDDTARPAITAGPTITSSPESGDTYGKGDKIVLSVTFSDPVTVTGKPRLHLTIGETKRWARYNHSDEDGARLFFIYKVKAADNDADGISIKKNSIALNGGTIQDADGNAARLRHGKVTDQAGHKVNGSPPEPAPEPTATPAPEPTATPAPTPTATPAPTPTATPAPTPTATPAPTPTATPAPTPTATPAPTPTATPAPTPTATPIPPPANNEPQFGGEATDRSVPENSPAGASVGDPVSAAGGDDDTLTYALTGSNDFAIDDAGRITVASGATLDYETQASYSVTVTVHDGRDAAGEADETVDDSIEVTISVLNVDEAGVVSLVAETEPPQAGSRLSAVLLDPDGGVTGLAWAWARSADGSAWTAIAGATGDAYTPTEDDAGQYLRATASYADGHGPGKTAQTVTTGALTVAIVDEPPSIVEGPVLNSPQSGDAYGKGEEIAVILTFTEPVTVSGKPRLGVIIGENRRWAKYRETVAGGATLVFVYAVKAADRDDDGVSIKKNALRLKGGTIEDAGGNSANLQHPAVVDQEGHKVLRARDGNDAPAPQQQQPSGATPTITAVEVTSTPGIPYNIEHYYGLHDVIEITITFSENVVVSGKPIQFISAGGNRLAVYSSGSGSDKLIFTYTVRETDRTGGGIIVLRNVQLNGGTIKDTDGNNANLTHGGLGDAGLRLTRHKVHGGLPHPKVTDVRITSNPSDGDTYFRGEKIEITLTFSEKVFVTGNPKDYIRMGKYNVRKASYASGSGSNLLVFSYTVLEGDRDRDGIYVLGQFQTSSGKDDIRDSATLGTAIVHKPLGSAESPLSGHKVDGSRTGAAVTASASPNRPPVFDPPQSGGPAFAYKVVEKSKAGATVTTYYHPDDTDEDKADRPGLPARALATDPDGDTVTYALTGHRYNYGCHTQFSIDDDGYLKVGASALTIKKQASCDLFVNATDSRGASTTKRIGIYVQIDYDAPHVPGAPQVIALPRDKKVIIQWWGGEGDKKVTGYQLWRADAPTWTDITPDKVGQYTVTGLTNGTSYTFKIRKKAGDQVSPASREVAATPTTKQPNNPPVFDEDLPRSFGITAGAPKGTTLKAQGRTGPVPLSATDPDGDPLTYVLIGEWAPHFNIDGNGLITVAVDKLKLSDKGLSLIIRNPLSLGIEVIDDTGNRDNIAITVYVAPPVHEVEADPGAGNVGQTIHTATSSGGGQMTWSLRVNDQDEHFQIDPATGVITTTKCLSAARLAKQIPRMDYFELRVLGKAPNRKLADYPHGRSYDEHGNALFHDRYGNVGIYNDYGYVRVSLKSAGSCQ